LVSSLRNHGIPHLIGWSQGWIKHWFPEFEFTWLGEEMRENLPKEMDFIHEASNAARAKVDFEHVRSSLYIPEVITATKRVLIMEYIQGARVDDLAYLAEHGIDRNKVALELSRIFSRMVFLNGWFHAVSLRRFLFLAAVSDEYLGSTSWYVFRRTVVLFIC
jgi:predicted unusual protein kinase regulating ubiquinone biosynthesis (AarF/ABC1/UbiB family)